MRAFGTLFGDSTRGDDDVLAGVGAEAGQRLFEGHDGLLDVAVELERQAAVQVRLRPTNHRKSIFAFRESTRNYGTFPSPIRTIDGSDDSRRSTEALSEHAPSYTRALYTQSHPTLKTRTRIAQSILWLDPEVRQPH